LTEERFFIMANISTARKLLQQKLAEATTPAEAAQIAEQLTRLVQSEDRKANRARRKREKAKASQPQPKPDDSDTTVCPLCLAANPTEEHIADCQRKDAEYKRHVKEQQAKTLKRSTKEWEHRRKVREDLRKMGQEITWDREIDGVPHEELPPPETPAEKCIREHAARQAQGGNGWSRTITALEPLEVFDRRVGAWVPSEMGQPYSSIGPQLGEGFPAVADCVESNSYNNEDGWSWETRDGRQTNDKLEREREEEAAAYRERAEKLYGK
jgi:hypothetical protein